MIPCGTIEIVLTCIITLFVIYLLIGKMKNRRYYNLINKIPGPKTIPILGNVLQLGIFSSVARHIGPLAALFQHRQALCKLFSNHKIFRVWIGTMPIVVFHKAESIEVLLSSNVLIEKGLGYDFVAPWLGRGLLTSTGAKWKTRRRQLTPAFHFRILQDFFPIMNHNADILVEKLRSFCQKEFVDVVPLLTMCTLDIICETAMGISIKAQEQSSTPYIRALKEVTGIVTERMFHPWLAPDLIFALSSRGRRFYKSLKVLHDFTRKVIRERKQELIESKNNVKKSEGDLGEKHRVAFLELLLELHLDGHQITEEEIREEVDTFMFEGHDTTTYGLAWALYLIGLHADIQRKVRDELHSIFGGNRDRPITREDLAEMKYMDYVIKESQRLFPSVPTISRKLSEDVIIDGYTVPMGTRCQLFHYEVHRDTEVFPEPEVFNPDRFLPENSSKRHPYAFVPFSAGPRNCIGQKFAMNEEKIIIAAILRNFEITSIDPRDKIIYISEIILKPVPGIRLHLKQV